MTRAEKIKRDIDPAVKSRETRVTILVGDSLRNALAMLDEQPAAVLDALFERAKDLHLSGNAPKHRYKLRAALIEYLEERLHEGRARERQLAQAITGTDLPSD
jgi:hypothetical protein